MVLTVKSSAPPLFCDDTFVGSLTVSLMSPGRASTTAPTPATTATTATASNERNMSESSIGYPFDLYTGRVSLLPRRRPVQPPATELPLPRPRNLVCVAEGAGTIGA